MQNQQSKKRVSFTSTKQCLFYDEPVSNLKITEQYQQIEKQIENINVKNSTCKILCSEQLVNVLEKKIKQEVLNQAILKIQQKLDKNRIFTIQQRQRGLELLKNNTNDMINYELDRLELFNKEVVFINHNVSNYQSVMQTKNKNRDNLIQDIINNCKQIGCMVKKYKLKNEIFSEIKKKVNQKNVKIKADKNIQRISTEFLRLNFFIQKAQQRCDKIQRSLSQQLLLVIGKSQ